MDNAKRHARSTVAVMVHADGVAGDRRRRQRRPRGRLEPGVRAVRAWLDEARSRAVTAVPGWDCRSCPSWSPCTAAPWLPSSRRSPGRLVP
ncbi:hypothetical protein HBB16_11070 [Pseudonocardia sp. MCCB 268]|nr:hypothetical protein [Pseudonocardia cytotoxica]